jgi:hypothetical protein
MLLLEFYVYCVAYFSAYSRFSTPKLLLSFLTQHTQRHLLTSTVEVLRFIGKTEAVTVQAGWLKTARNAE